MVEHWKKMPNFSCTSTISTFMRQVKFITYKIAIDQVWKTQFYRVIGNVATIIKCIARTGFVLLNNIYCIPTYLVWMTLLLPVKLYQPQVYWRIEGLFFHWLLAMVSMWSWSAGYDSKLPKTERKLIGVDMILSYFSRRTRRRHKKFDKW